VIIASGGLALAILLLIAFPAELLNSTLASNTRRMGRWYAAVENGVDRATEWFASVTRTRALAANPCRSVSLFGSAEDYVHSCIRTGITYSEKTARAYDRGNGIMRRPCYECMHVTCFYDYWTMWHRIEVTERYDTPATPDDESYDRRAKRLLPPRIAAATEALRAERARPFDPALGGEDWARWCAAADVPFDAKVARQHDVAANIEDLPAGQCYACLYARRRANFAYRQYKLADAAVKAYWDECNDNNED
jgi:hypothetical protein